MAKQKRGNGKMMDAKRVESIRHKDKRANIPTEELRDFVAEDEKAPKTKLYPRDPSLDPQLVWKGKDEQDAKDLAVPVVPVYIQEKIHPHAIIEDIRRTAPSPSKGEGWGEGGGFGEQFSLFADFNGLDDDFDKKVDFYQHEQNWTNRMILGDSLLVMTSLAEKEGLKGKVQSIYFDPPYGIKFGSNWQVSTRKRDVKDGKAEDATRQPEQVRAFRDTWKLGIHSYLAYLRDRLVVARELLTETSSVFVQIGDENVHLVRSLMDEVFGSENFVGLITVKKTAYQASETIANVTDYLLWYARSRNQVKVRPLFMSKLDLESFDLYRFVELPDGTRRRITRSELSAETPLPQRSKRYRLISLISQGASGGGPDSFWFEGKQYRPPENCHWKTTVDGLKQMAIQNRISYREGRLPGSATSTTSL